MLYSSGKIVNFQLICFQASAHNKNLDVGANIFIGNLDPEIDEKLLYDTFSAFGVILQTPKVPSNVQYIPNLKKLEEKFRISTQPCNILCVCTVFTPDVVFFFR